MGLLALQSGNFPIFCDVNPWLGISSSSQYQFPSIASEHRCNEDWTMDQSLEYAPASVYIPHQFSGAKSFSHDVTPKNRLNSLPSLYHVIKLFHF